jgi:uncharacterized protein YyaL (SSP411 family)
MLQALDFSSQEPIRAVVAGAPSHESFERMIHAAHSVYQPNKVVMGVQGRVEAFVRTLPVLAEAKVYICTGDACQAGSDDPVQIKNLLS